MPIQDLSPKELKIAEALAFLTPKEQAAYRYFLASINRKEAHELPEDRAESLYLLFQTGKSCEEIRRLNHPNFSLGQIVVARITNKWDERLDAYRASLSPAVQAQVAQVHVESASFITDMIVAVHRLHGDQVKKFLQTGDKNYLKGTYLENINFKQYAELIKTLALITGQDNKTLPSADRPPGPLDKKPAFSSADAADLLNSIVPDKG